MVVADSFASGLSNDDVEVIFLRSFSQLLAERVVHVDQMTRTKRTQRLKLNAEFHFSGLELSPVLTVPPIIVPVPTARSPKTKMLTPVRRHSSSSPSKPIASAWSSSRSC